MTYIKKGYEKMRKKNREKKKRKDKKEKKGKDEEEGEEETIKFESENFVIPMKYYILKRRRRYFIS